MTTEATLQTALLLTAPEAIPNLRLFRRNVGVTKLDDRVIRFGVAGMADLWGYWRGGSGIEVELKTATGSLSTDQKRWQAFCHEWGVPHIVLKAQKDETVEETVKRWCDEIESAPRRYVTELTGKP
jgi:hypothetical protein